MIDQHSELTEALPSFLVSYVNLRTWLNAWHPGCCREWVLDSGAYSALTSGKVIDLSSFIDDCLSLRTHVQPPSVVFALDVIGDPEKTLVNAASMRSQGIEAVSTFHYGSPWHYLQSTIHGGRVAFGGMVARGSRGHGTALHANARVRFLEQCMCRAWPVWSHGFGCCDERILQAIPLCSADSTTWSYGLQRYGALQYLGINRSGIRDRAVIEKAFKGQIGELMNVERRTRSRFGRILAEKSLPRFDVRFVFSGKKDHARFKHLTEASFIGD